MERITIDNNEVLSYLEQNKTLICIDICTRNGLVKTIKGNKNGKSWDALQYYTWAKEKENGNGESNGTTK